MVLHCFINVGTLYIYTLVLCMISVSVLCLCLGDTVLYIDCHVDCVDG